jgi:hypothetical protein
MKDFLYSNLMKFTMIILILLEYCLCISKNQNLKQVPKATDLSNHFGSALTNNLYGPNHYLNKDSFLNNENGFLVNFNPDDKIFISSGKNNLKVNRSADLVSPFLPVGN